MATMAIEETWEDVRPMMYDVAYKFWSKYGGDFNEWVSEGHQVFMRAYNTWDPNKKFTTWFGFLLRKLFLEKVRRAAMRSARAKQVDLDVTMVSKKEKSFDVSKLYAELSDDGRMLVELVLDTPTDIKLALVGRKRNVSLRDRMIDAMVEFLQDVGWEQDRIWDSFEEVQDALS